MRYIIITLFLFSLSALSGCAVAEWLTRDVQKEEIQAHKDKADAVRGEAEKLNARLAASLEEARVVAEATKDKNAIEAVAVLTKASLIAGETLTKAKHVSDAAQKALDSLPEGGKRWQIGLALAWPLVLPFLAKVPYVGPFISLGAPLIESAIGSAKQKATWAETEARAKALTHQTDFANEVLQLAVAQAQSKDTNASVREAMDKIQAIKDAARAAQERDGVATVIRAEVLQHPPV